MRLYLKFIVTCILCCSFLYKTHAISQKDSAVQIVQRLTSLYENKKLSEKVYLDTIFKTMVLVQSERISFSNKELLVLLTKYRQISWHKNNDERLKQAYYTILSQQARLDGRNGEMLYYAEQLSEIEQKVSNHPSTLSLNLIATYYDSKLAFPKVTALYKKYKQFVGSLPQRIGNKEFDRKDVMRSADLLYLFSTAAYNVKDTALGAEVKRILAQTAQAIKKGYATDIEVLSRLRFSVLMAEHEQYRLSGNHGNAWKNLQQLDSLQDSPNTPQYLKSYIHFHVVDQKALFFLDTKKNDSAEHYINLLNGLIDKKSALARSLYMVKKYEARLLYNIGRYKESEDSLVKALEILEAEGTSTLSEVDEIMYALTKVEEQQLLLADSARRQRQSDYRFVALAFGSLLLLGAGLLMFLRIRRRQKARFVNFKLSLAQNIHDETNPALLYAKILAKEQRVSLHLNQKGALEQHIDHTMELIRSLSKDLKSDQQLLVSGLVQDIRQVLEKMSVLSEFSYTLRESKDIKRFLSHYQYSNLKAILQECITNSIKHAVFRHIYVTFSVNVNVLQIRYKDDGIGWEKDQVISGIGLENIQDRIARLNGNVQIKNDYPNCFEIVMDVNLSVVA
ncbi:sensory histidine kinase UhpB [compost metagenome]